MSIWKEIKNLFKSEDVCNCRNCENKREGKYIGYMPCCKTDNIPMNPPKQR